MPLKLDKTLSQEGEELIATCCCRPAKCFEQMGEELPATDTADEDKVFEKVVERLQKEKRKKRRRMLMVGGIIGCLIALVLVFGLEWKFYAPQDFTGYIRQLMSMLYLYFS